MTDNREGDDLAQHIATILEIDSQYVAHVDFTDESRIKAIRSAGRAAGRILGWKVRTFQTDPAQREDGKVVVIVAVAESTPEDEARLGDRSDLLMGQVFKQL